MSDVNEGVLVELSRDVLDKYEEVRKLGYLGSLSDFINSVVEAFYRSGENEGIRS